MTVGLPSAHTEPTRVGLVGVLFGASTSRYRICPAIGATSPNTGFIVTLPVRLTELVRSCLVGVTVVITVPRSARSGLGGSARLGGAARGGGDREHGQPDPDTGTDRLQQPGPPN